jgi:hypothetical protein
MEFHAVAHSTPAGTALNEELERTFSLLVSNSSRGCSDARSFSRRLAASHHSAAATAVGNISPTSPSTRSVTQCS